MVDQRQSDRRAPEGAVCQRHPERPALAMCPVCGRGACIFCWHDPFDRCQACLDRDPTAAAPPVPWEDPSGGSGLRRTIDTMVTALRPTATAPSFSRRSLAPAVLFMALTALPLALLRGIIPYTHLLRFGPAFQVRVLGDATTGELVLDVIRAMGISLLLVAVAWSALALPYVSLAKAYGTGLARRATLRLLMYRGWLLALGGIAVGEREVVLGLAQSFAAWGFSSEPSLFALAIVQIVDVALPLMLLLFAMRAGARFAAGTGALVSFVITVLPFVLMFVAVGLTLDAISPWLPGPPPPAGG